MAEEVEEEDFEDVDEKKAELIEIRDKYKQKSCDAVGANIDDGFFYIILYKDIQEKAFYAKLDMDGARMVRNWCNVFLAEKEVIVEGYQ